jgi:ABC-type antimicrobial peptide transport system permease subunit
MSYPPSDQELMMVLREAVEPEVVWEAWPAVRKTLIRETVLTMLVEGELNQKQLIEAVKPEVEAVLHTPVGTMAIRDEVVVMAQEGALHARPTGQNRPVFYSLPRADYSDYSSLSEAE